MKLTGHPTHHGHHVNPAGCGSGWLGRHRLCSGFSGDGYDTYLCGCCCHDADSELNEEDRAIVARVRGDGPAETTTKGCAP